MFLNNSLIAPSYSLTSNASALNAFSQSSFLPVTYQQGFNQYSSFSYGQNGNYAGAFSPFAGLSSYCSACNQGGSANYTLQLLGSLMQMVGSLVQNLSGGQGGFEHCGPRTFPPISYPQPPVFCPPKPEPPTCKPEPPICVPPRPEPPICKPEPPVCVPPRPEPPVCKPEPPICKPEPPICKPEPPTCEPPKPPVCPPPISVCDDSRVWGDPHFVGAEGGKYDVQGEDGKIYNMLSDQGVQINGRFGAYKDKGATVIKEVGITHGNDFVTVGLKGALNINGEEITKDGTYLDGAITKKGNVINFKSDEYDIDVKTNNSHINMDFGSGNVVADGVLPHGLWGQTADGDGEARSGDRGAGAQGGGAIEDADGNITERGDKETVTIYEVASLDDTSFDNHNKFNVTDDPEVRALVEQLAKAGDA